MGLWNEDHVEVARTLGDGSLEPGDPGEHT